MLDLLRTYFAGNRRCQRLLIWFLMPLIIILSAQQMRGEELDKARTAANNISEIRFQDDLLDRSPIERGRLLYEAENYNAAIRALEPAIEEYRSRSDLTRMAMVFNNLALAHQQLGDYAAVENNLNRSFKLLQATPQSMERQTIEAQAFDIKGKLALDRGQAKLAWESWQQAGSNYDALGDRTGLARSRLNQVQALQAMGFYRRALNSLEQLQAEKLVEANNTTIWRSLGNTYLAMGQLKRAKETLLRSLSLAKSSGSVENTSKALLSLGNLARSQQDNTQAVTYYRRAIAAAPDLTTEVQARLNLLNVLIADKKNFSTELVELKLLIAQLPSTRSAINAKINYGLTLLKISTEDPKQPEIESILQRAIAVASQLGDRTAEAYGLKSLGRYYELRQQWRQAIASTQQSLVIAQEINARDITYQGQWQLGRIYRTQQRLEPATAAYQQAVEILQSLRNDLVAVNPEIQFTFRESIEPIYREYVSLLLNAAEPGANKLAAARSAIDSLQLAELENFFQATCLDAQPVAIDRVTDTQDLSTAVVYPIVLPDRFEIIVKLPQQQLRHYTTPIDNSERTARILDRLSQTLAQRNSRETLPLSQQVYSWLIAPAAADLAQNKIETLVFVLDSPLRNIPMSVLHDGKQYLIEKYAVAITPGLQLIQPQAIANRQLRALTAGLTEARSGFPALKYVANELETIKSQIANTKQLVDREFTNDALQQQIARLPFPIVHLATHGQFSSQAKDTFVLTLE